MPYWIWVLIRAEENRESSGTDMLLPLRRAQKSTRSCKQKDRWYSSLKRKRALQGSEKYASKPMLCFSILIVDCETATYFLIINSALNNEVDKLTSEHYVHIWCQRKWGLWLLIIFFLKQWWFGKLDLIKLCRSSHSLYDKCPCMRGGGEGGYFFSPRK